jgi:hypothetical protein
MDILKAPPPRPPIGASTIPNDLGKSNGNSVTSKIAVINWLFSMTDLYDVLIHSGGPDMYFNIDANNFINETLFNSSLYNISNSSATPNITTDIDEEPVSELIIMAITSMILGLMILVTVIGKLTLLKMFDRANNHFKLSSNLYN